MVSTDKKLAEELLEAGNKLVNPPSSVDELLLLLDQIESCLSKVEQSPSAPMQNAPSPSLKAIIDDKLVKHVDVDVKVAVASCLSEITRITAPDAPYNDDQMKDIFRLIVSSFENLHDKSSRSYKKRTSILETVSKVRSCVVMLDLECDELILEMFQHFLKTIREDHPENVFSSMETIMILVLEESEDISLELLSSILASVKKNNEDILPIAQKLGERVLESSAAKIKPYLVQAVNALGISLDDYSDVLASICQDASGNLEQNDVCATSDHVVCSFFLMDSTDKELAEELLEAGNKIVDPPSVDELLIRLDQIESCLSKVEQSPSAHMQNALSPSLKALIDDKLVKHVDVDVKVAVASCLSEITRITAPDAPYNDDQMKDIFRLIVSSFENLHDKSSRSYRKRTSILETVSKVRSCVVMLDLECDDLILEMFQHFLKTIREDHPENVFSCMETIMTLVLEESEDISLELLSPILASVKKNNEDFLPIAQKLGVRVLESSAVKIKPYLVQAVNALGISLDDYSDVLASICQDASGNLEQNDVCATNDHAVDECKSAEEPMEESAQAVSENKEDSPPPQQDAAAGDRSPKSVMTNGVTQAGEDDALADSKSQKKQDGTDSSVLSKSNDLPGNKDPNDLDPEKVDNKEQKLKVKQGTKRKGRKPSSSKLTAPSEVSNPVNEKEAEKSIDSKSHSKEVPSSPNEDGVVEAARPLENDKETNAKISSPTAGDGESDAVSSSPIKSNRDENRSKGRGQTKKKDIFVKEVAAEDVLKKVFEGTSDSEVKPTRPSAKKGSGRNSDVKITTAIDAAKKGSGKTEERNKGGGGSSSRKSEDKKRKRQGKGNSEKGLAKSSAKDENKEMAASLKSALKSTKDGHSEETPKTNLKRKRTPGKQKESENKKYDESLVGIRVKVWWPDDEMFYKGVIDSYDSSAKKHKVSYDDGDLEILNLKEEKWEKIVEDDDAGPDGEEGSHRTSPAAADMPPKKKGKRNAGESKKEVQRDTTKSGGTSSKSKAASTKSSHKSKTVDKSEDEVPKKSKDHFLKSGGKSGDTAQKSKSKNTDSSKISKSKDDVITPKPSSAKSKQETLKTGKSKQESSKIASSSKTKSSKSGKSNTKSSGKVKSSLLKIKGLESENSDDSTTEIEDTKVKMLSSSKAGKMKSNLVKTKDSENESSDESTEEDTRVKMLTSSKSGKKRGRN